MPLTLKGTLKPGQPDKRYYMIRVQVNDRRVAVSSGTRDRVKAEGKERLIYDALSNNRDLTQADLVALVRGEGHIRHAAAVRASGGLTLSDAFARCFADPHVWRNIRAQQTYKTNCKHVTDYFGADRVVASITRSDLQAYVTAQLEAKTPSAPGTINRRLACLGRMFSAASDWDDGPKAVPKIKYLAENGARKFSLSHEQERAMFAAVAELDTLTPGPQGGPPRRLDAHLYLRLFKVLVESGVRLTEALKLQWTDVQMTASGSGVLRFYRTKEIKNNKARSVPMTEVCAAVLKEIADEPRRRRHGPFEDLNKNRAEHIWNAAKARSGITDRDCVIHALRHTCATRLLKATGNIVLVKEWLGHTTIKTTADTYAHVETESLMDGAEALTALRGTSRVNAQAGKDSNP
jgi:integrase